MISHARTPSRIQRGRGEGKVRTRRNHPYLSFSLRQRLCYHGGNSVFISVVLFRTEAVTVFWSFALLSSFHFSSASAQVVPVAVPFPVDPTGRSGEPPTLPKQFETPTPPPGTLLPPAPIPPETAPFPTLRVFVREIRVTGSTIFSAEELAKVTAPVCEPGSDIRGSGGASSGVDPPLCQQRLCQFRGDPSGSVIERRRGDLSDHRGSVECG